MASPFQFEFHSELNPKLWDAQQLKPEIREALLKIADEFLKYFGIPVVPSDIIMTGSLANYNYSATWSDIDIHILLDVPAIGIPPDVLEELFAAKTIIWNERDIQVKGFDVELYLQDLAELDIRASAGAYSLLTNTWIAEPSAEDPIIDVKAIRRKAKAYKSMIDHAVASDCDAVCLKGLKDQLKEMRNAGLEAGGEYSVENLAFKVMRRNGTIEKLVNAYHEATDKELSLESLAEGLLSEAPEFKTLKKNSKALAPEERETVMKAETVWHHGPNGEETPAVRKAVVNGKTWYWCATHRAGQVRPTLKGAVKAFEFIKTTA